MVYILKRALLYCGKINISKLNVVLRLYVVMVSLRIHYNTVFPNVYVVKYSYTIITK